MRFDVDLRGFDVAQALEGAAKEALLDVAQGALEEGLAGVVREAKAICPMDTGVLRGSISARHDRQGDAVVGEVKASAPYAARVEMGGAGRIARPFLYPAFKANQAKLLRAIERAVSRRVKEG